MSFKPASIKVQINTSDEMNNSLNELFNVVFDKSPCSQKPFNERHLPKSFFVPPSGNHISHTSAHHKASSSPTTLAETYRAGPGNNHFKQHSLDSHNDNQHSDELDHLSNMDVKVHSPSIEGLPRLDIEIKKLPLNYGMAVNDNGQVYFLDHATKRTTWFDPRLPEDIQKWGMTLSDLQELHIQYMNMMPARHFSVQKQATVSLIRSQHQHLSKSDQANICPDSKSQIHYRSCSQPVSLSGGGLGLDKSTLIPINFQASSGQPMAYLANHRSGNDGPQIVNSYHEFRLLHPHDSSAKGSQSQSSNSSCSNLSSCLNGLNLSPVPQTSTHHSGNVILVPKTYYGGLAKNVSNHSHSHQDSEDSGVGQSIVSQGYLSTNFGSQNSNDQSNGFDTLPKLEDCDNAGSRFNDIPKFDEYMDVDVRSLNY